MTTASPVATVRALPTATSGAAAVKAAIAAEEFRDRPVTVVGYGTMGRHYVQALRALGVGRIRVCSRSTERLQELDGTHDAERFAGGIESFAVPARPGELGIVCTTTERLIDAAQRLVALGVRRLLIEKPVSLWSAAIEALAHRLAGGDVEAICAFNRVAYPSLLELRARAIEDGGIRSCVYTMTEMIKPNWPERFPAEELARWGIANSLHVASMAHALIGWPAEWQARHSGRDIAWHPAGSVFVGSGVSEDGVPFAWHADWGSKGRWSVEIHTVQASYRLCPLEQLFCKTSAVGEWEAVPVEIFAPQIKAGLVEQVAAMLSARVRAVVPLVSLEQAASLTRFGENVFGYSHD